MMKTFDEYIKEEHQIYDTETDLYYHGSWNKFDEFVPSHDTNYTYGIPVYFFTKNINYARNYGTNIYVVKLNIGNSQIFDTSKPEHMEIYKTTMKQKGLSDITKQKLLQDFNSKTKLPIWWNDFAYYAAWKNQFQGILISEEYTEESIGVFNKHKIKILKVDKL